MNATGHLPILQASAPVRMGDKIQDFYIPIFRNHMKRGAFPLETGPVPRNPGYPASTNLIVLKRT